MVSALSTCCSCLLVARGRERFKRRERQKGPSKTDPPGRGNPGGSQIGAGDRGGVSADRGCILGAYWPGLPISRSRVAKGSRGFAIFCGCRKKTDRLCK